MLYSSVLELCARGDAVLPPHHAYHGYDLVLSLLRRASPETADAVHSASVKPLAVAVLGPPWPSAPSPRRMRAGAVLRIRVGCLRDDVFTALVEAVLCHDSEEMLNLGGGSFDLVRLATTRSESAWAACASPEDLLARAEPDPVLRLRFLTPTTFRSKGHRNVMFPEPALLIRGYARRWREAGGAPLPRELEDALVEHSVVARYTLRSGMVDFGGYAESGFLGSCELRVTKNRDATCLRFFQALGHFATFAGTGAKTAMGLGLTTRVSGGRDAGERTKGGGMMAEGGASGDPFRGIGSRPQPRRAAATCFSVLPSESGESSSGD